MKIFRVNECDWYAAEDFESAIKLYMEDAGISREDVDDGDPEEVSPADMNGLTYTDNEAEPPIQRSFAEQLSIEMNDGKPFPRFFASTEY